MSNILSCIKDYGVVIAAAIGALASFYIYKTQYKKATYFEMYKRCYAPIYRIIKADIEAVTQTATPLNAIKGKYADISISKNRASKLKKCILEELSKEPEYCPKTLLTSTENLTPDNFAEYCLFINDNYLACQSKLGIIALKTSQAISIRRIKTVISSFLAVMLITVAFISSILFLKGEGGTAFAIMLIAIYIVLMWIILFDR